LALKQAAALSPADQYRLHAELTELLSADSEIETEAAKQVRVRAESLVALAEAADHVGLSKEDRADLTTKDANQAWKELGSGWRSGRVIKAWGYWNTAKGALLGRGAPPTEAQRDLAKRIGRHHSDEEWLDDVRKWLKAEPGEGSFRQYAKYRARHNDRLSEGERPMLSANAMVAKLGLPWRTIVAVARNEVDLKRAQAGASPPRQQDVVWSDLIAEAAKIVGVKPKSFGHYPRRPEFPLPAATIGGRRLWRREDVEVFAAWNGQGPTRNEAAPPYATKEANEMQGHVLSTPQLCRRLGLTIGQFVRRKEAGDWDVIPPPEAKAGTQLWWRLDQVEEWERDRDTRPPAG